MITQMEHEQTAINLLADVQIIDLTHHEAQSVRAELIEKIAAAIAAAIAAEREACAKIADDKAEHYKKIEWYPAYGLDAFAAEDERIAAAIRARGEGSK